ncbi:hypothetical protein AGMMS49975_28900 [Clostridia bacterium]|nr:hypothetical protein AGMMS49975_28900 [Clostridia bacterium]
MFVISLELFAYVGKQLRRFEIIRKNIHGYIEARRVMRYTQKQIMMGGTHNENKFRN